MKKLLLLSFWTLLLLGCSSSRQISHAELVENAPDWVKQTPNHTGYYHGVGMAVKTNQGDFRERARQNALSELAAGISVQISSTSVLNQFDIDNISTEYFRDNIRMSAQQDLEGYELVENWENDHQYWVYYRLSRSRFEQIRQERQQSAVNQSMSKYEQARQFASQGQLAQALGFYVQAFEDVRDFLGEDLNANMDGEKKNYTTSLMTDYIQLLQSLEVVYPHNKLAIKPGARPGLAPVEVRVLDSDNRAVSGIPVDTRFSWRTGHRIENTTSANGSFYLNIYGLRPGSRNEEVVSQIRVQRIVEENTNDIVIRRMLTSMAQDLFVLPVEVITPAIYLSIESEEDLDFSGLKQDVTSLLRQDGFNVIRQQDYADLLMQFQVEVLNKRQHSNRFLVNLLADISVVDTNGKTLYSRTADNISGLGQTYEASLINAYQSLAGKMTISIYPQIINTLFFSDL